MNVSRRVAHLRFATPRAYDPHQADEEGCSGTVGSRIFTR